MSASIFILHTHRCKISWEFSKGIYCLWENRLKSCVFVCAVRLVLEAFSVISCQWCKLMLWSLQIRSSLSSFITAKLNSNQPQNHNEQLAKTCWNISDRSRRLTEELIVRQELSLNTSFNCSWFQQIWAAFLLSLSLTLCCICNIRNMPF